MNIIKFHKMKRARFKDTNNDVKFNTTPKIFVDYRHYIKDTNGVSIIDTKYDYNTEISKQIEHMKKRILLLVTNQSHHKRSEDYDHK